MPALVMGGVGGMVAFFAFSFWLVAAVAEATFWPLALGMTLVALALFTLAAASRRSQLRRWEAEEEKAEERSTCKYCGSRNAVRASRCESCGAPL